MRNLLIVCASVLVAACGTARASIVGWDCCNDGDGKVNCAVTNWTPTAEGADMTIAGDQFGRPGHMIGYFDTNSAQDPTVTSINSVENDDTSAWAGYAVNVYMALPFTLSSVGVSTPGWSVSSVSPVAITTSGDFAGDYEGSILYNAATPLPVGGTLDFSYKFSFSGATHYVYTQEMMPLYPVPEPATMALLSLGFLGLLRRRRQQRNQRPAPRATGESLA